MVACCAVKVPQQGLVLAVLFRVEVELDLGLAFRIRCSGSAERTHGCGPNIRTRLQCATGLVISRRGEGQFCGIVIDHIVVLCSTLHERAVDVHFFRPGEDNDLKSLSVVTDQTVGGPVSFPCAVKVFRANRSLFSRPRSGRRGGCWFAVGTFPDLADCGEVNHPDQRLQLKFREITVGFS